MIADAIAGVRMQSEAATTDNKKEWSRKSASERRIYGKGIWKCQGKLCTLQVRRTAEGGNRLYPWQHGTTEKRRYH